MTAQLHLLLQFHLHLSQGNFLPFTIGMNCKTVMHGYWKNEKTVAVMYFPCSSLKVGVMILVITYERSLFMINV